MNLFDVSAILLTGCAVASYINHKWIKLPLSIGLLLLAMALGWIGLTLKNTGLISDYYIQELLSSINFQETVFHGMLSFLLFAGALQVNIDDLKTAMVPVIITATISTLISTILIGFAFYFLANQFGFSIVTLPYAMLFGAILSPTDPITAMSITKKMKISKKIEMTIVGESLFNDGVALVFFLAILDIIKSHGETSVSSAAHLFLLEVGGGILFGAVIGWIASQMLSRIDAYHIELLITLTVATAGYTIAEKLKFSAPLAMVIAGLIIGHQSRRTKIMEAHSRNFVDSFWEVMDDLLNAMLFFLLGLEMIAIDAPLRVAILGVVAIFIALAARFISVAIPLTIIRLFYPLKRGTLIILTWGGLRGALSIAMVLSLEHADIKEIFLPCIYFVVVFSIAVQGLTLSRVIKRYKITKKKVLM